MRSIRISPENYYRPFKAGRAEVLSLLDHGRKVNFIAHVAVSLMDDFGGVLNKSSPTRRLKRVQFNWMMNELKLLARS